MVFFELDRVGLVIAVAALVSLVVWELRVDEPVINFRLLRNAELRAGAGIAALLSLVLFGPASCCPN